MYPLKLKGLLKEKIWGGRNLEHLGKDLPVGKIGESWEVACNKNGSSFIQNGLYKGMTLCQVMSLEGENLVGKALSNELFPLLVKFIDANENLSIQVHPGDNYSHLTEGQMGKTELWYILEAKENAEIILGQLPQCSIGNLVETLDHGDTKTCLNHIKVKKGDAFYIPSGTVHGIGKGVVLLEIQQNSDETYRLFDYGRGRKLHSSNAIDVINLSSAYHRCQEIRKNIGGYEFINYEKSPYFEVDRINIHTIYKSDTHNQFILLTCIDGQGFIETQNGSLTFQKGETILLPATLGKYKCIGKMEIIMSMVPRNEGLN